MALVGTEEKALREGKANLRDAFAEVRGPNIWLCTATSRSILPAAF